MINGQRLWDRLMELSRIGAQTTGGVTRLSFSEEERQAKALVAGWMKEAGLEVREDAAGNLIGRKEGTHPQLPVILTGSHLDSVYQGGHFDGPLGVLSALEAVQTMQEQKVSHAHSIEVVAFTDEEGARFSYGMIGSRAMAGKLKLEDLNAVDSEGISIREAMVQSGFDPDQIGAAKREKGSVKAYLELHIEQGKVLESKDMPVGVVSGIAGPLWLKMTLQGEAGHAGTTPMHLRKDALAAAAEIMLMMEKEAQQTGSAVATVGQLQPFPGGINIIPGRVELSLDLRDIEEEVRNRAENRIGAQAEGICQRRGVQIQMETLQRMAPVTCAPFIQEAARQACSQAGLDTITLPSGAGHDGMQLAEICPICMIFVRSKDGISHNPKEWSSPEDCTDGARVLYYTLLHLAQT